jgi:hypothetical protein
VEGLDNDRREAGPAGQRRRTRLDRTLMGFHDGNATTPDSLRDGYMTKVLLAEGIEPGSDISGEFLFHQEVETRVNDLLHDTDAQDQLMSAYAERTGVALS